MEEDVRGGKIIEICMSMYCSGGRGCFSSQTENRKQPGRAASLSFQPDNIHLLHLHNEEILHSGCEQKHTIPQTLETQSTSHSAAASTVTPE